MTWREGSDDWLASRFARVRVRAAHHDHKLSAPRAQEWLLIEWPEGDAEPAKYWLASLPDMKAAAGAASTITPVCASPPTAS